MPAFEEHPQTEHRKVDADRVPVDQEEEEERRGDDQVLHDPVFVGPDQAADLHGLVHQEDARYRKEGCGCKVVTGQDGTGEGAADQPIA